MGVRLKNIQKFFRPIETILEVGLKEETNDSRRILIEDNKIFLSSCVIRADASSFTFQLHTTLETLVETASGTFFSRRHRNWAHGSPQTHVVFSILHCPLEEALARFTTEDAVMEARNFIAADRTRTVDELLSRDAGLRCQRRMDEAGLVFGFLEALVLAAVLRARIFLDAPVEDVVMERAVV